MPKVLDDQVRKLKRKGMSESKAFAIATDQLQKQGKLKEGTQKRAKPVKKK